MVKQFGLKLLLITLECSKFDIVGKCIENCLEYELKLAQENPI